LVKAIDDARLARHAK